MKTGFYTGRFQPFHLGHLSAVKQALREVDFLIIGIGSSQYSHEPQNPFTAEERIEMIKMTLKKADIEQKKYTIIPVPDIHSDRDWPAYVRTLVPPFDKVFVGDDGLVKELFEKYDRAPVTLVNRELDISATKIREGILKNTEWKASVVPSVARYLEKIDAKQRLEKLYKD